MEKLAHLWNVSQFMTNLKNEQARNLQAFYTECCKNLENEIELPKQNFGPLTMCPHCGMLWKSADCQIRISKGRKPSKGVKRLMKKDTDKMPKVRSTLVEKCRRNEMNKLVIKCSLCSKNTEIPMLKPKKEKQINSNTLSDSIRKKKKKKRDKTAGLNIPGISTPKTNSETIHEVQTPKNISGVQKTCVQTPKNISGMQKASVHTKNTSGVQKTSVQTPKPKKLNVDRLRNIITHGKASTSQKRKSLHNFLTELY